MDKKPKLSVVIPAYNEEKRIGKTIKSTHEYLKKQDYNYEIIVVDNASTDKTCDVVEEFQEQYQVHDIVRLCLADSVGKKGSAVRLGIMEYAEGEYIMFMDADNATPISEIEKFWPYFEEGLAVVIGSRDLDPSLVEVKQTFKRRVLGKMSHLLIRFVLLPGIHDSQAGFKAFTDKAAKDIFSMLTIPGWGFDMEVLRIARDRGYSIKEVGVIWREAGGTHVPMSAFFQSFFDLFVIRFNSLAGKYRRKTKKVRA